MKKASLLLLTGLLCHTSPVLADTVLGVHAGFDYWAPQSKGGFANSSQLQDFRFNDRNQSGYYLALEHLIPVLPNVRVQYQSLENQGSNTLATDFTFANVNFAAGSELHSKLDLSHTDYVLYYELLDNALVQLDLGVAAKHLRGKIGIQSNQRNALQDVSQWLPLLYLDTQVALPATGLDIFASGQATRFQDSHYYDVQAGIGYQLIDNLLVDVRLKLGYRAIDMQLDDLDNLYAELKFNGVFAGIAVHF